MSTATTCRCGCDTTHVEQTPHGPHYGRIVCDACGAFRAWARKPGSTPRRRRESAHRDLVARYGRGVCELCHRPVAADSVGTWLEAHHVIEYAAGGTDARSNIWIVCVHCHRLIHLRRAEAQAERPTSTAPFSAATSTAAHTSTITYESLFS